MRSRWGRDIDLLGRHWLLAKWGLDFFLGIQYGIFPFHRQATESAPDKERGKLRAVAGRSIEDVPASLRHSFFHEIHLIVPESRHQTPPASTSLTPPGHYHSRTSGCQESGGGRATLSVHYARCKYELSIVDNATMQHRQGSCPPSAPRSSLGWFAPHRFDGRPGPLSLTTHQSPIERHGKREKAARNGMGGRLERRRFLIALV